jgi:hypothetical protein
MLDPVSGLELAIVPLTVLLEVARTADRLLAVERSSTC